MSRHEHLSEYGPLTSGGKTTSRLVNLGHVILSGKITITEIIHSRTVHHSPFVISITIRYWLLQEHAPLDLGYLYHF